MDITNTESYKETSLLTTRMGTWEYRLGLSRAGANATARQIADEIETHRARFLTKYGCVNNGAGVFMSAQSWESLAKDSDAAARDTVMAGTRVQELDKLASIAEAAAEKVRRARQEYELQSNEYHSIPDKIDALNKGLALVARERELIAQAPTEFQKIYDAILNGWQTIPGALDALAGVIATAELRKPMLDAREKHIRADLKRLEVRQTELRKELGLK